MMTMTLMTTTTLTEIFLGPANAVDREQADEDLSQSRRRPHHRHHKSEVL
jgi:hypothetical protein